MIKSQTFRGSAEHISCPKCDSLRIFANRCLDYTKIAPRLIPKEISGPNETPLWVVTPVREDEQR